MSHYYDYIPTSWLGQINEGRYEEVYFDHESVLKRLEVKLEGKPRKLTSKYAERAGGKRRGRWRAIQDPNEDLQYIYDQIDYDKKRYMRN